MARQTKYRKTNNQIRASGDENTTIRNYSLLSYFKPSPVVCIETNKEEPLLNEPELTDSISSGNTNDDNLIGLARIKASSISDPPVPLHPGVILGRCKKRKFCENRPYIGINLHVSGVSREQVQVQDVSKTSLKIKVIETAKNAIKVKNGGRISTILPGKDVSLGIGDRIVFDAYEVHPNYVYKVVSMQDDVKNVVIEIDVGKDEKSLEPIEVERVKVPEITKARESNIVDAKSDKSEPVENATEAPLAVAKIEKKAPQPISPFTGNKQKTEVENIPIITPVNPKPAKTDKELSCKVEKIMLVYNVKSPQASTDNLKESIKTQKENGQVPKRNDEIETKDISKDSNQDKTENEKLNQSKENTDISPIENLTNENELDQAKCDKKEVTLSIECIQKLIKTTVSAPVSITPKMKSKMKIEKPKDSIPQPSPETKIKTTRKEKNTRIKKGSRFRVDFEELDIFGTKRLQWFFGTASKVTTRTNLNTPSSQYKYEIDMKYDDESNNKVVFPDPGVQLLTCCDDVFYALTEDGQEFAYDTNPDHVEIGDLVDCRMECNEPFARGRVAAVDKSNQTCFVVFPDDNYEPNIPLQKGCVVIAERGAIETKWLIGMNIKVNKRYGRITRVTEFEDGRATVFEIKFKSKGYTKTFKEVMEIIFSYWIKEEENDTTGKIDSTKLLNIISSENTTAKSTTLIHTSLSNTLYRALNSNPYNGFEMISHFSQARNVENRSLAKRVRSVVFECPKEGWDKVNLVEFAMRWSEFHPADLEKYVDWSMFERYLAQSTTLISYKSSGSVNITRVFFLLEYLSQVLGKVIQDQLYESFFGSIQNIHNAFKELSQYTATYWSYYHSIILDQEVDSVDPNLAMRVRRCLEAFGLCCSRLSLIYCNVNGVNLMDCAFIIKDSLYSQIQNCTLTSKSRKQLYLRFVLSFEDGLQECVSRALDVSLEFAAIDL